MDIFRWAIILPATLGIGEDRKNKVKKIHLSEDQEKSPTF